MSTGKTPRWESELWSYISQGDGQHCPAYSHCQVRLKGEWCADDNREVLEKLYTDNNFRPEKYPGLGNAMTNDGMNSLGSRIKKLANKYLKEGNCHCPPVPAELISLVDKQYPVEIRLLPLKSYHGVIWCLGRIWVIQLNSNDTPAVRRFSLFHEAFHILAHRRATPVFRKAGRAGGSFNELMADLFASYILMPEEWVRGTWAGVKDLDRMAELFIVPKSAMWLRLKLLGLLK